MKQYRYLLMVMLLALLAMGCRSTRQAATTTAPATVAAPAAPQRQLTVITFSAIVNGFSASGQMRVAEDSVLWVSVNKLVELGRAMATPDSVWVTTTFGDHIFAGTYDDLQRLTKRRITFVSHTVSIIDGIITIRLPNFPFVNMKVKSRNILTKLPNQRLVFHFLFYLAFVNSLYHKNS